MLGSSSEWLPKPPPLVGPLPVIDTVVVAMAHGELLPCRQTGTQSIILAEAPFVRPSVCAHVNLQAGISHHALFASRRVGKAPAEKKQSRPRGLSHVFGTPPGHGFSERGVSPIAGSPEYYGSSACQV